jgi:multidrug resistance efflux pump
VATATDEELTRSYTFLIKELTDWYGHYVDKINLSMLKADESINQLETEIESLKLRSKELFNNIIKATKATDLQVELQELQKAKDDLDELKILLEKSLSREEIEKMIKTIIGDEKLMDESKREKLITDVDEEIKYQGIRGDWSVAEYVIFKEKEKEIIKEIKNLHEMINSLEHLSDDLASITDEISKLF